MPCPPYSDGAASVLQPASTYWSKAALNPGGVVTDVSFIGVSTQYLVKMPWGQELMVFAQNTGRDQIFRFGDSVELSWRPEYAFLLDHSQDVNAGAEEAG